VKQIREKMLAKGAGHEKDFYWRGGEVSRIEALADGVFAFALTLLVVSLSVPGTYDELVRSMLGFFSFAACFALLTLIWYSHYVFFRRYGLEDKTTIVLNAVLLFVVLFYIYPLKFLATLIIDHFFDLNQGGNVGGMIEAADIRTLMMIYALGFIAVFGILTLMFRHALRQREELELDDVEAVLTKGAISYNMIFVAFGAASLLLAFFGKYQRLLVPLSGWIYALMGVAFQVHGRRLKLRVERTREGAGPTEIPAP